jgi:putative ABC transport system permease protein
MRWSLLELWRRRGRFAGMTATVGLLSVLAMVLLALSGGLWEGATGAVQRSTADLMVFSRDSLGILARSRLPLADLTRLEKMPGVAAAGALGTLAMTVSAARGGIDVAEMGTLPGRPEAPPRVLSGRLPRRGEPAAALADIALRSDGVRIGTRLTTDAGGIVLRVVGFTADNRFQLLPTVWTTITIWQELRASLQPESSGLPPDAQALTVRLVPGVSAGRVARVIDHLLGVSALTPAQAALQIPGARQMRSTIDQLIASALGVAMVVTALFFALITAERRGELARLRALGATTGRLARGLLVQGEAAVAVAVTAGSGAALALLAVAPPSFPVAVTAGSAASLAGALLLAGGIGASFALIRVAGVDRATVVAET